MAAGTVTITETAHTSVKKIKFAWVSGDAGGDAGNATGATTLVYDGKLELLTTIPAAAGSAPTDDYDIAITDADGVDVLGGGGQNRDTANTEQVLAANLGAVAGSKLTFTVTNAGNAKAGTAYVYLR
jgi:hypothetical protein